MSDTRMRDTDASAGMKGCASYTCEKDHAAHITGTNIQVTLVRGRKRAYLWVGEPDRRVGKRVIYGQPFGTVDGPKQLRALAKAILAEVGDG